MPKRSKSMIQALHLQQLAHQSAVTLANDLQTTQDKELRTKQAQGLSAIIRAFDTIEERKRILAGKPMPGSLRPDAEPKKMRRSYRSAPVEIVEFKTVAAKESLLPAPGEGEGGEGGMGVAVK